MTEPTRDHGGDVDGTPSPRLVVATHSREVKTALFLALNAVPAIIIVATAASTAELISYCHAFRPNIAIVESGLPGRSLEAVLAELGTSHTDLRILLMDEYADLRTDYRETNVEAFTDLDQLISTIPEQGADAR